MRVVLASLIVAAAMAATGAHAAPQASAPEPDDAALAARLDTAAELADQNRRSEALNVEINRKNREVQARNDAKKAAFEKAMADYKAAVAQHDAAAAQTQAAYDKAVVDWKAAVAACKGGDVAKCQKLAVTAAN